MATSLKLSIRTATMNLIPTSIGASGHILLYTGTEPSPTATPTGTLLLTCALASTSGTVSGAVLTMGSITNAAAVASGTPGYYRVIDGATDDGTHTQIQGSAGVGSGDINFPSTIASGATSGVSSLLYTEGNP
jgi:hypothetical protein